jgi:chromate transporter
MNWTVAAEIGTAFLRLGISSFGGPIAHLGYFHREFVDRRRWLDADQFAQLLALCQFLPGPASSQLGFSLGLLRGGWLGAVIALVAFALPSAILMFVLAVCSAHLEGSWLLGPIHVLKLVAVVVVAQGVISMARTLTPDAPRIALAVAAAAFCVFSNSSLTQLAVIAGGAILGPLVCRRAAGRSGEGFALPYGRPTGTVLLLVFGTLLGCAVATGSAPGLLHAAAAFYRCGALVFGGGHVVLPLLQDAVVGPGWIDTDTFLAGYGAVQAMPGPMFSISAFLGERLWGGGGGALGAAVSLLAIFLPGLLLIAGTLPFWKAISARDWAARMMAGVNAVVVGLLVAALYNPLWTSAVHGIVDLGFVAIGLALLLGARR